MGRATPTPRPSKVPSFRYLSRTMFRTGECSAAQSIFLWPSGARDGSLTMDSLCMASPLRSGARAGLFLRSGLDLLAPAEQKAADDDAEEERDQAESDPEASRGGAGAQDQANDECADASNPHKDVTHGLEPGGGDL